MEPQYRIVIVEDAQAGKTVVVTEPTDRRPAGPVHIQVAPGETLTPHERFLVERFVIEQVVARRRAA